MAFLQKTWKDRVAEYINRRVLTKEDGTTELVSVERSEGTISQEGDAFSAANMNDLEQRIANEFSEQNKNLTASDNLKFQFATDGEGNYGYLGADDSFIPFKKGTPFRVERSGSFQEAYSDTTYSISNKTVENDGYAYATYSALIGGVQSSSFTVNNVSQSFNKIIPVKKGDVLSTSITVSCTAHGGEWLKSAYIVLVYT